MSNYFEFPMFLMDKGGDYPFMMDGQYWMLCRSAVYPNKARIIRLIPSDGLVPWDFDYGSERYVEDDEWNRIVTVYMNEDCTDTDDAHMWDDVDPYWDEDRDEDEIVFVDPDEPCKV
jgi:hypothetical protein